MRKHSTWQSGSGKASFQQCSSNFNLFSIFFIERLHLSEPFGVSQAAPPSTEPSGARPVMRSANSLGSRPGRACRTWSAMRENARGEPQRCREAGVDAIPFWTFADGSSHAGVLSVSAPWLKAFALYNIVKSSGLGVPSVREGWEAPSFQQRAAADACLRLQRLQDRREEELKRTLARHADQFSHVYNI